MMTLETVTMANDKTCEDPVIEAYKRDLDRSLIRRNLRRTVAERF